MFRKLSLRALYDNQDEMTLRQRLVHTVVINVCPVLVFCLSMLAFREWVWPQHNFVVVWK